jgi:hypothetical protein
MFPNKRDFLHRDSARFIKSNKQVTAVKILYIND